MSTRVFLLCFCFFDIVPVPSVGSDWHPVDDIASTAEKFLESKLGRRDKRVSAEAGELDQRLTLSRCSQDLEPFLRRGSKIASRTVVGVRCNGKNPWKLYVAVDVVVSQNVLIAARSLPRGHQLAAADVIVEERDVSRQMAGFLSRPEELNGKRLKHPIMSGRMLTPGMLQADLVVRRGQSVTLLIRNGTMNISMAGKALMDGTVDQRIRVENSSSGRVIEGVVRSSQHVEILLY